MEELFFYEGAFNSSYVQKLRKSYSKPQYIWEWEYKFNHDTKSATKLENHTSAYTASRWLLELI